MKKELEFEFINCICCGKSIESIDEVKMHLWENGVVKQLSAGYGSKNDGDLFYIGICDECIDINYQNGRLIYHRDYMMNGSKFSDKELEKMKSIRLRERNLNKLI
jgi:hypothetical protein